ncbi:hypothetical protein FBZ93_10123 [Bradyrhizobium macuxiense]|uniref:DUF1176 domain-containing protein n=1 Tax=Bradyrhizobium macuxiense TaxID=1755647 RepID=A0A560MH72_9BRAD|nr:hypothetical protein [Bradyrhizobium macuxiense]TWC06736.1 hypothetical protein FBZ93_10123 [Bradyrhizobium macuxiense]
MASKAFRQSLGSRTIFTLFACLLAGSMTATRGDESSSVDARREALREWASLANGRTDFEISDPALVPRPLALAAEQSGCKYKDDIEKLPVRFMKVAGRRLVLMFCRLTVTGSHQAFDLSDVSRPKPLEFPYIAEQGFGTTDTPGFITWKDDAGLLQAETSSDECPSSHLRHVYRLGVTNRESLIVVRVEVSAPACGTGREWTTIWEAKPWPVPSGAR